MNGGDYRQPDLVDTTDCLEAVSVFRSWKNFFFIIVLLGLLVLAGVFFMEISGGITRGEEEPAAAAVMVEDEAAASSAAVDQENGVEPAAVADANSAAAAVVAEPDEIEEAAKEVAGSDANEPIVIEADGRGLKAPFKMSEEHLYWILKITNFILVITAILYSMTMLFILKTSLMGRLGGVNHIARAFFLSLLVLAFLLPWQKLFPGVVAGAMFTPEELTKAHEASKEGDTLCKSLFYLRFCGLWLLSVVLLFMSYFRSCRWAKTMLKRLEVM